MGSGGDRSLDGDPAPPPSSLPDVAAQRRALEEFARRIRCSRAEADDLVQEALLVALERPAREGVDRMAWLRGVLRRLARRQRSSAARRRTVELEPTLSAESAAVSARLERAETAERLARLVLELEEPYRGVLFLRYWKDLTPSEIAAALGRPPHTVESQLARGLERLRARHGAARRRTLTLFLWLRRRRPSPRATLALAAAASIAALLVALFGPSPARPAAAPSVASAPPSPASEGELAAAGGTGEAREPSAPTAGGSWLELEVVDETGAPLAGTSVHAEFAASLGELLHFAPSGELPETDERGRLRLPLGGPSAALILDYGRPSECYYRVQRAPPHGCAIRLRRSSSWALLGGRVVDADGEPRAEALVTVAEEGLPVALSDGTLVTEVARLHPTGADGSFPALALSPGFHLVHVHSRGLRAHLDWVYAEPGATIEREFVLRRGRTLPGIVVDEEGAPVPGANVSADQRFGSATFSSTAVAITGSDGRFLLEGLRAERVLARAAHLAQRTHGDVAFLEVDVVSRGGWRAEMHVREPLRVQLRTSEGRALEGYVGVALPDPSSTWRFRKPTDADGLAVLDGIPAGFTYDFEVWHSAEEAALELPPAFSAPGIAAGPGVVELVLSSERPCVGALSARFAGADGAPPPRTRLHLRALGARRFHPLHVEANGSLCSERVPCGRYAAVLVCPGLGAHSLGELDVAAGETRDLGTVRLPATARVRLDWRWGDEATQFELVALTDVEVAGAPVSATMQWLVTAGASERPEELALLPGRYRWTVRDETGTLERRELELAAGEAVELRTPAGAGATDGAR